jgi:hypothetical protein
MYTHAMPPSGSSREDFAGRDRQSADRVLSPVTRRGMAALAGRRRAHDLGGLDALRRRQHRARLMFP